MQLVIDIGNSSLKAGIFPENRVAAPPETEKRAIHRQKSESPLTTIRIKTDESSAFRSFLSPYPLSRCLISSTSVIPGWLTEELESCNIDTHIMDGSTPLPIENLYSTPSTLGTDRISSVIGAYYETGCKHAVLCIDSGTALTYDIVNENGQYLGGNISPGLDMRFRSLHEFTSRLPLVSQFGDKGDIGTSTETAIRNGVINGITYEIKGYIRHFRKKYPELSVFFTGGNAENFADRTKNYIFADKNLVLKGLNIILNHLYNN